MKNLAGEIEGIVWLELESQAKSIKLVTRLSIEKGYVL